MVLKRSIKIIILLISVIAGSMLGMLIVIFPSHQDSFSKRELVTFIVLAFVFSAGLYWVVTKLCTRYDVVVKKTIYWLMISCITSVLVIFIVPEISVPKIYSQLSLTIRNTGEKNVNSNSTQIWINGIKQDNNRVPELKKSYYKPRQNKNEQGLNLESPGDEIQWKGGVIFPVKIDFVSNSFSGIAEIMWNGKKSTIDLYSQTETVKTFILEDKGLVFENVIVTFASFYSIWFLLSLLFILLNISPIKEKIALTPLPLETIFLGLLLFCVFLIYSNKAMAPVFLGVPEREAQTMSQIRFYFEHGIDLLKPMYDLTPKPTYLLLEFPIYHAFAVFLMKIFGYSDILVKQLSVLAFIGSLVYLYKIIKRLRQDSWMALIAIVLYAIAPFSTRYQPIAMVDPIVNFLSLLCLYHGLKWIEDNRKRDIILFTICGLLGFLLKFIPFMVVLFPWGIEFLVSQKDIGNRKKVINWVTIIGIMLIWCGALFAWVTWASYWNRQTNLFFAVNSGGMFQLYFGNIQQRLHPAGIQLIMLNAIFRDYTGKIPNLPIGISVSLVLSWILMIVRHDYKYFRVSLAWGVGFIFTFLLFFPAISVHTYYWLPSIPAVVTPLAYSLVQIISGSNWIIDRLRNSTYRFWMNILPFVGISVCLVILLEFWDSLHPTSNAFGESFPIGCILFLAFISTTFLIKLSWFEYKAKENLFIIVLLLISMQMSRTIYISKEYWWKNNNPIHMLIEMTDYIHTHLPEDETIAIVSSGYYRPDLLYMAGARGYTLSYPSKSGSDVPCMDEDSFPYGLEINCVKLLHNQGINDIFVIIYPPDINDFMKKVDTFGLYLVDQKVIGKDYGQVLHYKIVSE